MVQLMDCLFGMAMISSLVWLMVEAFAPPSLSAIARENRGYEICEIDDCSTMGLRHEDMRVIDDHVHSTLQGHETAGDRGVLKPGDILLGRCRLSPVPALNPFESWTHAAIYAGDGTIVVAGNPATGVVERPLESWMYPEMTWVCYVRVEGPDESIREKVVEFARDRSGQPYDVNWLSKQLDGDSWYCSELIWAAYHHASEGDIDLVARPDLFGVSPDEIYAHEATFEIGGHYEKRPDTIFSLGAKISLLCILFCAGALWPHGVV